MEAEGSRGRHNLVSKDGQVEGIAEDNLYGGSVSGERAQRLHNAPLPRLKQPNSSQSFLISKMRNFFLPVLATAALSQASGMLHLRTSHCMILTDAAIPFEEKVSKRAVGTWDAAYTKATAALAKLSQSEKIGIVTGVGWSKGPCVGNTKAASSIGYPSLCLQGK
jgi:hypothetical protein